MHGLISLHEPEDADIDIVFIHGLNGSRTKTWTRDETLWPAELLPKETPSARILTYGYDSKVVHFWSQPAENRIDTFSNAFFSQLTNNRSAVDATHRPVIIVAHSLGGIVVANALIDAASNSYGELSAKIRGIMFLGTPHRGSSKAKWGEQARKFIDCFTTTNSEILKDLDKRSEKLAKIGDAFPSLLNTRGKQADSRVEIVCFYEGRPMEKLGMIVDEMAATLAGYEKIMLDADHSGMCKFARDDDNNYRLVAGILGRWCKDFSKVADGGGSKSGGGNTFFSGTNYGLQQYSNSGIQTNNFGFKDK